MGQANAEGLKIIGETETVRESTSFRAEIIPGAKVAIIYDKRGGARRRLLTADGRLTALEGEWPRSVTFDRYVWDEGNKALYVQAYGGPVMRLNPHRRQFERVEGLGSSHLTPIVYVPRWKSVIAAGSAGLQIVRNGVRPLRSQGMGIGHVDRVDDLARFRALLLTNSNQELFIRSADGVLHPVGRFTKYPRETVQVVSVLRGQSAVQVHRSREAVHISMVRGPGGVWRPENTRWVKLDKRFHPWFNGYVPALDAVIFYIPSWKLLDWWHDRSGYYRLSSHGLVPVGTFARRAERNPKVITFPGIGTSLLSLKGDAETDPEIYQFTEHGSLVPERRLDPLGRSWFLREVAGTGIIIGTDANGGWFWDGKQRLLKVTELQSLQVSALPLAREVLLHNGKAALVVDQHGRTRPVVGVWSNGHILQAAPDRIFVIGKTIVEIALPHP